MPKYQIEVDIKEARGTQLWEVEADSPEDAIKRYHAGEGDIVHEEIEVTSLHEPTIDAVSEVE